MEETLSGMRVFLHPTIKVFVSFSIIALQLSLLSYTVLPLVTLISDKEEQPSNAYSPMEETLSGIVIEVSAEQSWNAYIPMEETLFGIVISVREEQP